MTADSIETKDKPLVLFREVVFFGAVGTSRDIHGKSTTDIDACREAMIQHYGMVLQDRCMLI